MTEVKKPEASGKLEVSAHAVYRMAQATPSLLQIEVSPVAGQTILEEELCFSPTIETQQFTDIFGNRNRRFSAPAGKLEINYRAIVELQEPAPPAPETPEVNLDILPPEVLAYLFPSRYCESDRLAKIALDLFGDAPQGAGRVFAICDWIRSKVVYEYGHTNSNTSAFDMVTERIGVCRDFSHLAIAFCRALNIPARYAAGYCLELEPPDFHAYFQAYLASPENPNQGQWYNFDATYERVRRGLVNISVGRDAVDTSMMTFFGSAQFEEQTVSVREFHSDS